MNADKESGQIDNSIASPWASICVYLRHLRIQPRSLFNPQMSQIDADGVSRPENPAAQAGKGAEASVESHQLDVRGERESGKIGVLPAFGLVGKRGAESAEVELKTWPLARECKKKLRKMIGYNRCAKPLPELVEELNTHTCEAGPTSPRQSGGSLPAYQPLHETAGVQPPRQRSQRAGFIFIGLIQL